MIYDFLSNNKLALFVFSSLFLCLALFSFDCCAVTPIPPPPYTQAQVQTYMSKGWKGYKANFITTTGRVMRIEDNSDTVSEGQAYAMLLAVNFNDKTTFDKCFAWAEANLSRMLPGSAPYGGPDNLLAWHWITNGGVQGNGWDAASDADGDYAQALLLAYEKWGQQNYLDKALAVLNDILAKEVYQPASLPPGQNYLFLKPGNWGEANIFGHQGIYINPSYLSPAWYRHFDAYLPDARWDRLVDGSYHIINTASNMILDPVTNIPTIGVGMLPDWAFIDDTGVIYFTDNPITNISTTICSWDWFRLPWRVYADVKFTHQAEPRADTFLNQLQTFYQNEFNAGRKIVASYYYSGIGSVTYTSPAASGIPLLCVSLNPLLSLSFQTGMVQTAVAYIIKSAPTNPPTNTLFSGPDTFQDLNKTTGYFIAPGDILRYYINSWGMLGLLTAYQNP